MATFDSNKWWSRFDIFQNASDSSVVRIVGVIVRQIRGGTGRELCSTSREIELHLEAKYER